MAGGLEGRTALVTGGAGGIGREVARSLAGLGARIVPCSRDASGLEAVAREIRESGGEAEALVCDVRSREAVGKAVDRAASRWGGVDVLVNAAGDAASAPLARTTDEIWDSMMSVNLTAPFLFMRALVPSMRARGWGRIVSVASTAGRAGFPYISAYCASKHGLVGLTRAVAAEVASSGITVNAVCPGYVDTPMTRRSVETIVRTTGRDEKEARAVLEASSPQKRLMTAAEVAHLVAVLCMPESAGITGQAIVLDGGGLQR
jgi:3-hydroxybutyrate dehydrogenase